jgi:hypothetical protein
LGCRDKHSRADLQRQSYFVKAGPRKASYSDLFFGLAHFREGRTAISGVTALLLLMTL